MPRSIPLGNFGIVIAVLVFVKDDERDGRASRLAFENAGKNLDLVFFVAGCRHFTLTRPPAVQLRLDHLFGDGETGWASVEDGSDRWTMGFTPCRDCKNLSKCA